MEKQKNRRRIYRLFLQPQFQLKYGAYFMTLAVSSLTCSSLITLYVTMNLLNYTRQQPESEDIAKIFFGFVLHNPMVIGGTLVVTALFYFMLAVFFSKRIVGPIHALVKHVEALKNGNYIHKTNLRKGDDLRSLMVALNDLSDSLKERHHQKEVS